MPRPVIDAGELMLAIAKIKNEANGAVEDVIFSSPYGPSTVGQTAARVAERLGNAERELVAWFAARGVTLVYRNGYADEVNEVGERG